MKYSEFYHVTLARKNTFSLKMIGDKLSKHVGAV